ncbi:hypothetical protein EUX98_g6447 [Antrodiella citrinella]|uniref:RED-like N-terminal domain-containing protein n=1 Tax=Antrodiella citrinella TaxID=2447956 RepID=A0A4S4MQU5_9APHY|nr:hypothetical protein EUX98_g6447 [Antrodiella citrinella]
MDQDSFRQLLQKKPSSGKTIASNAPAVKPKAKKAKAKKGDGPEFKPRTVKKDKDKVDGSYRDRALERRTGKESDYAQIEALAEDFEKRAEAEDADKLEIEEQRKYLGGDGDHSVLVKGLDFALLEQNKARALSSTVDDDTLEQAFIQGSSASTSASSGKKRTREDIVRELKNKRPKTDTAVAVDESASIEEAKKAGKFKPIGFKPVGSAADEGKWKKKVEKLKGDGKDGITRKKKKKAQDDEIGQKGEVSVAPSVNVVVKATKPVTPAPEPEPEDFDIFADAGEYNGLDLGDDDDEEEGEQPDKPSENEEEAAPPLKGNWFAEEEEGQVSAPGPPADSNNKPVSPHEEGERDEEGEEDDDEPQAPMRLVPLASSSIPSIKDILAMDDAAQKEQKRRAKKEKKKAAPLNAEGKIDRDYQRLKSYTEKKSAAAS